MQLPERVAEVLQDHVHSGLRLRRFFVRGRDSSQRNQRKYGTKRLNRLLIGNKEEEGGPYAHEGQGCPIADHPGQEWTPELLCQFNHDSLDGAG